MDEAASRLAMELESVPTEIDQVQRRLMQLELAARQLAEETEEHAQRAAGRDRRGDGRAAAASWPACASSGKRKSWAWATCSRLAQRARPRPSCNTTSCDAAIKEKQAAGMPVDEADYQQLYELDVAAQETGRAHRSRSRREAASREAEDAARSGRRLLRQEVGPRRNRRSRQRLDRHPRHAA